MKFSFEKPHPDIESTGKLIYAEIELVQVRFSWATLFYVV
jgi:hypothetical protein